MTPVSFWVWLEKMVEEESRRLHLNEMQLPLPPALFEGLDLDCVRFYPPEELEEQLRLQIADYAGVDPSFVFIYSGIDGLIELMYKVFWDRAFLIHDPAYYVYEHEALRQGISLSKVKLRFSKLPSDFSVQAQGKVTVVVNPNNPTGNILMDETLAEKLLSNVELLVVDEAYYEFSGVTFAPLLEKWPNLVIFRTFSKAFGLAGARVAYMLAHPKTVGLFSQYSEVYRVSTLSLMLAKNALADTSYVTEYVQVVKTQMERLINALSTLHISSRPSVCNFILVDKDFAEFLVSKGFKIKFFEKWGRLTVPSPSVTEEVIALAENYRRLT